MARTAFCLQNSMTKRRIHRLRRLPEACPTFGRVTDPKLRARRTATLTHTHMSVHVHTGMQKTQKQSWNL